MANRSLLLSAGIIFIPVAALLGSLGIGHILLKGTDKHQIQSKYTAVLSAQAASKKQSLALEVKPVAPTPVIFSVPEEFRGTVTSQIQPRVEDKVIALTFDDGPAPKYTQQILEILKQENIKATFFCVGEMVHYFPQLAKQEVAEGHVIGNHTWHHWLQKMNSQVAANEIESTATAIFEATGVKTSLFRPPYGALNNGVADYAKKNNYAVLMWSDDSQDYRRPSVARVVNNVLREAKPGGMVLMHDGGGNRTQTVAALPKIIANLKQQGYRFVTVPQLLAIQAQKATLTTVTPSHQPNQGT
ncbi:polysaccharide deacetylase [Dulcicalothrix desertica PCC 7102]|uniref:Polysaccharide deacetylase n=1 Tax=Dulcicalothrix desertica PCC 7102 TaxID=232991 RepID=A0A433V633_9CYAN|nr:polysaccharide deacetylase family protein [Dulcicalothrix desertica]RUT01535.1 polysaccharide deacetylase [Dulcicalothrix desertica PCC 7102]